MYCIEMHYGALSLMLMMPVLTSYTEKNFSHSAIKQ